MSHPTVCLSMIVKNESAVITRCLDSISHLINYWVISDTGSEDGTQDMIKNYFASKNIPGILREDKWLDFAHNRNIALKPAMEKADYVLIMDADDFLECDKGSPLPIKDADSYRLKTIRKNIIYYGNKLVKSSLDWNWVGVLHEDLLCHQMRAQVDLPGDYLLHSTTDGSRSTDPDKYKNDIRVLEKGLRDEPENTRYQFYLAQSYRDDGNYEQALVHYTKRVEMGGWYEEVYRALLEIGRQKIYLNYPFAEIIEALMRAYTYRPVRYESIHDAVKLCRIKGYFHLGYHLSMPITETPLPRDVLFVENLVYEWQLFDEMSICAINSGHKKWGNHLLKQVINAKTIPASDRERMLNNINFSLT